VAIWVVAEVEPMVRQSMAGILLLLLTLSVAPNLAGLEPAPAAIPSEAVLERFPIAKNAYSLLVPVEIKGQRYLFLLDTGSSQTIFD
jgi:hypothetical protein